MNRPKNGRSEKNFAIPAEALRPIAEDHGFCFATDRIVVDSQGVGYMYREAPEFEADSGWRFFSGDESPAYVEDPNNLGIYDVNTIANYDARVVACLAAPVGSEFESDPETGELVELETD